MYPAKATLYLLKAHRFIEDLRIAMATPTARKRAVLMVEAVTAIEKNLRPEQLAAHRRDAIESGSGHAFGGFSNGTYEASRYLLEVDFATVYFSLTRSGRAKNGTPWDITITIHYGSIFRLKHLHETN